MLRNVGLTGDAVALGTGLLLLGVPSLLQGQAAASMTVSATVLSAEAMRSWQAAAERIHPSAGGRPDGAASPLASIAMRTEHGTAGEQRVISVEYLRN